jgi:hypothetical protein
MTGAAVASNGEPLEQTTECSMNLSMYFAMYSMN